VGRAASNILRGVRHVELLRHASLLHDPGFVTRKLDSHTENGQIWCTLEATFPNSVPTHCKVQKFYHDDNFILRRMDYTAYVVKGVASHYKEFEGIVFPTLRRVIRRDPETDRPILEGCSVELRP
jgi:hypothetical protein